MRSPATCHPDLPNFGKGLCHKCYLRKWRADNKDKTDAYTRAKQQRLHADPELWKAERERLRTYAREHRQYWYEWNKKRRAAGLDLDRRRAHAAITNAVKAGKLIRQPCEVCGKERAEAHHCMGYTEAHWFTVQWLCRVHHQEAHGGIWQRIDGSDAA